jgi:hypothetical protein
LRNLQRSSYKRINAGTLQATEHAHSTKLNVPGTSAVEYLSSFSQFELFPRLAGTTKFGG